MCSQGLSTNALNSFKNNNKVWKLSNTPGSNTWLLTWILLNNPDRWNSILINWSSKVHYGLSPGSIFKTQVLEMLNFSYYNIVQRCWPSRLTIWLTLWYKIDLISLGCRSPDESWQRPAEALAKWCVSALRSRQLETNEMIKAFRYVSWSAPCWEPLTVEENSLAQGPLFHLRCNQG